MNIDIDMNIDSDMEELHLSTVYVKWPCHASILIILDNIYYFFSPISLSFSLSLSLTHTPILFLIDS